MMSTFGAAEGELVVKHRHASPWTQLTWKQNKLLLLKEQHMKNVLFGIQIKERQIRVHVFRERKARDNVKVRAK